MSAPLNDSLRAQIDRAAPPITVAEVVTRSAARSDERPAGGGDGRPARRWLMVAVALTVAAVGALALVPRAGDDSQPVTADVTTNVTADGVTDMTDEPPDPIVDRSDPYTGPTPSTVPLPAAVGPWQAIPAAEAFPRTGPDGRPSAEPGTITDVTTVPGGYLAVGSLATNGAGAWTSPDGRVWTERPLDPAAGRSTATTAAGAARPQAVPGTYARMDVVGSRGDTVVAAGVDSATGSYGPVLWRWTGNGPAAVTTLPIDNTDAGVTMAGVAATSRAFVVVGTDIFATGPGAVAWVSTDDGATWTPAATFEGGVVITSLTTLGDRLIAVGSTGGEGPTSAAWFSDDDGRTWTPADLPDDAGAGTGRRESTELVKVAAGGGRLLAYSTRGGVAPGGSRTDDAHQIGLPQELTLWSSADGASWTRGMTIPLSENFEMSIWRSTLTWGPAGWLLSISPSTYAWLSPDGTTVADTAYASGDLNAPWLRAAIGTPDGYLAIADSDHGAETIPVSVAVLPVTG